MITELIFNKMELSLYLVGCYDAKVTSYELFKKMMAYVISGPTN